MRSLAWICLLLAACSPVRPPERGTRPRAAEDTDALTELVELSQLVAVGQVEVRKVEPNGVFYQVRLREVLVGDRLPPAEAATHPDDEGTEIRLTSFLYRPGQPAAGIADLDELARYILFLAPTERPGEWLNLTDPNAYVLPAARETLERLRGR